MKTEESNALQKTGSLTKSIERLRTEIEKLNMDHNNVQKSVLHLKNECDRRINKLSK